MTDISAPASDCIIKVRIDGAPFNIEAETAQIRKISRNIGAIVSFTGLCRDENMTLEALEIEHYPGMAEHQIAAIAAEAASRWPLYALTVIHRYGRIVPGDDIVLVSAASAHRQAAFDAANFIMDFLKTDAPFWKKEFHLTNDKADWVKAKNLDTKQRNRW